MKLRPRNTQPRHVGFLGGPLAGQELEVPHGEEPPTRIHVASRLAHAVTLDGETELEISTTQEYEYVYSSSTCGYQQAAETFADQPPVLGVSQEVMEQHAETS